MADNAQQIRLCRARFAQDLYHFALRIAVVLLIGGNFCHHKLSMLRAARLPLWDE